MPSTRVLIAHCAGFDLGWLPSLSNNTPRRVIDSMLMARVLYPQQPIEPPPSQMIGGSFLLRASQSRYTSRASTLGTRLKRTFR